MRVKNRILATATNFTSKAQSWWVTTQVRIFTKKPRRTSSRSSVRIVVSHPLDQVPQLQSGASLAEFSIITPVVLILGMGTVQAGLIYHGKSTLNYATFEAARNGAVNNAQLDVMRQELGLRLAPLQGGDGSAASALVAITKSKIMVNDPIGTRVKVLNPTTAAFDDWGVNSSEFNRRVLPNAHLRHRDHTIGATSGLSLRVF